MEKYGGRHFTVEYAAAIVSLEDDCLYGAGDIVKRRYPQRRACKRRYHHMYNAVWQLGERNKLLINPDNALRNPRGKAVQHANGRRKDKAKLLPGHRWPRFYGKTWKEALFEVDRAAGEAWLATHGTVLWQPSEKTRDEAMAHEGAPHPAATVATTRGWWRGWRLAWIPGLVIAGIGLLTAAIASARYGSETIYQVIREHGPSAALMMAVTSKSEGYEPYFATAWAYFQAREFAKAEQILDDISEDSEFISNLLNARVHFAKAAIAIARLELDDARYHVARSEFFYGLEGNTEGLRRVGVEKVRLLLLNGQAAAALEILEALSNHGEWNEEISKLFYLLNFQLGDYEKSIEHAEALLHCGYLADEIQARIQISICHSLMGRESLARQYALEADALAAGTGDSASEYYLLMNKLYLERCQGVDITGVYGRLRQWAIKRAEYLLLVLYVDPLTAFPCSNP